MCAPTPAQGDLGLSLFQDGLLPSALSMGVVLSSPGYAEASKHWNAQRLVGAGAVLWAAAALGCGLAPSFLVLLLCRAAMGVGGAPFDVLASTLLGETAAERRHRSNSTIDFPVNDLAAAFVQLAQ